MWYEATYWHMKHHSVHDSYPFFCLLNIGVLLLRSRNSWVWCTGHLLAFYLLAPPVGPIGAIKGFPTTGLWGCLKGQGVSLVLFAFQK